MCWMPFYTRRSARRRPSSSRLELLPLDDRAVPAVLTVTSTADSGAGTLRDALAAAADGDTIQFDPSLLGGAINLTSGELVIDDDITIQGPAKNGVTVQRDGSDPNAVQFFRIFNVAAGTTATISGLVIQGGRLGGVQGFGGGIYNGSDGQLMVLNSTVSYNNVASFWTLGTRAISYGGGIYSDGWVSVADSTVTRNQVYANPGGPGTTYAGQSFGAGIWTDGNLTLVDSTVTGNHITTWVPDPGPVPYAGGPGLAAGGGVYSTGTLLLTRAVVDRNSAAANGSPATIEVYGGGGLHGRHGRRHGQSDLMERCRFHAPARQF